MTDLDRLLNERPQELVDALWPLMRVALASPKGRRLVPPLLTAFVRELQARALCIENATEAAGPGTLVSVRDHLDATAAAAAVGVSGDWIRKLCRSGQVQHQRTSGGRYLVNMSDLHRHYRGETA